MYNAVKVWPALVAGLALLAGSCGSGSEERNDRQTGRDFQWVANLAQTLVVSLSVEGGECRATVAGEAVNGEGLLVRTVSMLEAWVAVQEEMYGTVHAFPAALLTGAPELPWRCAAAAIYQLQRSGIPQLLFALGSGVPITLDLPIIDGGGPIEAHDTNQVTVRADGTVFWNGREIGDQQVGEQLRAMAVARPIPYLEIQPDGQARFEAVVALLAKARDAGIHLALNDYDLEPYVRFEGIDRYVDELK